MIFMRYPSRAQLLYKVCTSSAHIPGFEKAIIHPKSKYPPTEMVHWLGLFFLATTFKTGHFAFFSPGYLLRLISEIGCYIDFSELYRLLLSAHRLFTSQRLIE